MKRSRFSEERIIAILKEHQAGLSAAEFCRRHGISAPTFYKWRSRYGGLEVSDAKRLRAFEGEARARHRFERRAERTQAEEASGGVDDGRLDAARAARKNV